jgi:hypothetical protein
MRTTLALALSLLAAPALAADAAHPTLVELYQSQGCSDCPPADAALGRYADRPDWLALTFSVTYWDRLGWKDSFGRPEFTERQYSYAQALGAGVYTPQVIVNGRAAGVGDDVGEVEALAAKTERGASRPSLTIAGDEVAVGAGSGGGEVWLALYEPHPADVVVARGENAGRTLKHRNVVRRLTRLGEWNGAAAKFALPASGGLARAVWVQRRDVGPVLAAARG